MNKNINLIIAGVGGQGNVLAAQVVATAALIQGWDVIVGEIFGVSQRGGSVSSHIRIGEEIAGSVSPEHGVDIICGLEPMESLRAAVGYIQQDGIVLTNTRTHTPVGVNIGKGSYPPVEKIINRLRSLCQEVIPLDATALAIKAGSAVSANMALLGALSTVKRLKLPVKSYQKAIRQTVPKALEVNLKAFQMGRQACLKKKKDKPY